MKRSYIFSQKILNELPDATKQILSRIEKQAILVALFSGTCFGLTLSYVGLPFLAGFLSVAIIVFFIFEPLALTPSRSTSKSRNILRILFGLIIAFVNSIGLETVVFNNSISNYFDGQSKIEMAQIDSLYEQQIIPLTQQFTAYEAKSDTIQAILQDWSGKIYKEVNDGGKIRPSGLGKYARNFMSMHRSDSLRYAPILLENRNKIADLKTKMSVLNEERLAKHTSIIDPSERGILERLKALQAVLFYGDSFLALIFYFAFFLLAFFVELSTLISKWTHPSEFNCYLDEKDRQESENKIRNQWKAKQRLRQEKESLEMEEAKKTLQMKLQHEQEVAEIKTGHKHGLKDMVIKLIQRDSLDENMLDERELKKLRRKSTNSHLNGSDNPTEKPEE